VLAMAGWDPTLNDGPGYRNCRYGALIICTFTDELTAGTSYELADPIRLKIPADAAGGSRASALGGWYTPADFQELISIAGEVDEDLLGPKGTGPAVGLQPVAAKAAARAAAGQVDTNPKNNILISEFVVSGRSPDLAAVGAELTGRPGDKVKASVGFVNNGPGTLYHWTFDNTDPGTFVEVPPGTEAIKVDDRCFPLDFEAGTGPDDELAGGNEYLCLLEDGKTAAKASNLFDFTFQLREKPSTAAGSVIINDERFDEETIDRNKANDSAKITLVVGSGGAGGGLPVTGANAGLIGAGGAALLVAGAVGLLVVRRRRVRFTA
jgi:LPXTG-motif cell wall-anchored protein